MNEKIQALAQKSGAVFSDNQPVNLTNFNLERFSLLLVSECASIADSFPIRERYVGDYIMESMDWSCGDRINT
jgi:hypothetical protein